ncbi:RNA-directed DNA polymerase [Ornithinibacillus halotolerans]|uniref:Reverse transcriptase domain-containing protein n=1 Tax=Ornithinibacillus halotolerans TaxID=1274357 RepID=A0A916RSU7_9BACI|nr:RNA-directed DNA polymerase [Ornithinibacillus halotolerans]GGA69519.1 hypothetical protein GCM10008025_11850 [Ornithinibacillus halotolerans]
MKLTCQSVDWAKIHIQNYYDSDFFVKPFEFKAIWSNWQKVREFLTTTDINDFIVKTPLSYAAPKSKVGYRIVHQLDPMDSLIYTALAYEIAEKVEQKRIEISDDAVCSYRIELNDEGNFFSKGNGYLNFKDKSISYAESYKYVLVADITDFYNQVYLHRIQNAIEFCDDDLADLSNNIEQFLMKLTNKTSRGVPVGPAASIIMTEALMLDVDSFILSENEKYVRYVDDIRVFSNSYDDLNLLLHNLTKYLYNNHRLTLSTSKTKILYIDDFKQNYIDTHEEKEKEAIHESLNELTFQLGPYPDFEIVEAEPTKQQIVKAQSEAFVSLMEQIVEFDVIDLGSTRHILRKAKKNRTRSILPIVLDKFDFFAPVMRDLILYLEAVTNQRVAEENLIKLENIISEGKYSYIPYVQYWLSYYFTSRDYFLENQIIKDYVEKSEGLRFKAIQAKRKKDISWVRKYKNQFDQYSSWDRRAIIFAGDILPKGERKPWMDNISQSNDIVDNSLATYIKGI